MQAIYFQLYHMLSKIFFIRYVLLRVFRQELEFAITIISFIDLFQPNLVYYVFLKAGYTTLEN